jgi:hypothetical protein
MTKAKLIEAIQTKEAELYSDFKKCKEHYGFEDEVTQRGCTKWHAIYNLMESLGINDKQNTIIKE